MAVSPAFDRPPVATPLRIPKASGITGDIVNDSSVAGKRDARNAVTVTRWNV